MSVTGSLRLRRWVIACRWSWLLVRAVSTRSLSVNCSERISTGAATAMESSKASVRTTFGGASGRHARRRENCARRIHLDGLDQHHQDVVEQRELLFGVLAGAGEEQVGDAGEGVEPHGGRPRGERLFEFLDQGRRISHCRSALLTALCHLLVEHSDNA